MCRGTKCVMHLFHILLVMWGIGNVECTWYGEKEIEMSRHLICRENPKKLGDVVRVSY